MKVFKISLFLFCSILGIQIKASLHEVHCRIDNTNPFVYDAYRFAGTNKMGINIPIKQELSDKLLLPLDTEQRGIIGISSPRNFVTVFESRVPAEMQPQDTDEKKQQEKVQPFIDSLLPIFTGLSFIKELARQRDFCSRT